MIDAKVLEQIKPGAKVRVHEKEGGRFEGLVIGRKHGLEAGGSFTVRSIVAAVAVEKVYPVHSPTINKVDIISSPKKPSRSKLYFVREMSGSRIRKKLGVSI
jgi:large subunit ribosomal protein L19